jgi:hypothetical protein
VRKLHSLFSKDADVEKTTYEDCTDKTEGKREETSRMGGK